jgi:hypothetical protein
LPSERTHSIKGGQGCGVAAAGLGLVGPPALRGSRLGGPMTTFPLVAVDLTLTAALADVSPRLLRLP